MRYREIDAFKGILTLQMILAHCLQFFMDLSPGSWQHTLSEYINLTTFPGFIFAFGFVAWGAYLRKPYLRAAPRIFKNFLRMMGAYYVSAFAYRIFIEKMPLNPNRVMDTLLLRSLAGWSEFLLSFAALMLCLLILHPLLVRCGSRLVLGVALLATVACILPLRVQNPLIAVFLGRADFAVFAVLPYCIYFAVGLGFAQGVFVRGRLAMAVSLAGTGIFVAALLLSGIPSRFPLSLAWLLGAAFFLYCYYAASVRLSGSRLSKLLEHFGRNSLYYLLVSNLLIFALKSSKFFRLDTVFALVSFVLITVIAVFLQSLTASKALEHKT